MIVTTEIFLCQEDVAHETPEPVVFYCLGDLQDHIGGDPDPDETDETFIIYRPVGTAKIEKKLTVVYFKEKK